MKTEKGPIRVLKESELTPGGVEHAGLRKIDLIGRTLGDFVVREKIGEGGSGEVFRAEQPVLQREAVIKVIQADDIRTGAQIQRFLREARLASRLDHPFAAHTYAFGVEPDGLLWIAMELVRGSPLDEVLEAQGPLALTRFVPFFEKLCEVVQSAHEQGIIHRDLKPSNVMVISRAGRIFPKLLDLGIAKLREQRLPIGNPSASAAAEREKEDTPWSDEALANAPAAIADLPIDLTQEYLGSPHYMAPEQWVNSADADPRSDVYALGVVAYECLTGRKPFVGASVATLNSAHMGEPAPPLGSEFPQQLDHVLQRAMAKDPGHRFQTAIDFAKALRAASGFAEDEPTLPQLAAEVRAVYISEGPQPLAEAVAWLESARQGASALEAARLVLKVAIRYVAMLALACRARLGLAQEEPLPSLAPLLRRLHAEHLADDEWWILAQELCRPFASCRDAHPIPELVDLFFQPGGGQASHFLQPTAMLLETNLALLLLEIGKFLKGLFFLVQYPLAVSRQGLVEQWMGLRRPRRQGVELKGPIPPDGQVFVTNSDGSAVVTLSPLIQALAPSPGSPDEAFFLDGNGRMGAKLVAFPVGFERYDRTLWSWFHHNVSDIESGGVRKEDIDQAPFIGLSSFTTDQADLFFGREREAESFANRLRVQPLMGIVGPSGAGKSSFVQAGVVPLLPSDWKVLTVRPGPSPFHALSLRLIAEGVDASGLSESSRVDANALGAMLRKWGEREGTTVLLVVDQFEELITLCADATERNLYAQALSHAAWSLERPVRVVITARDDFLIRLQELSALRERLAQGLHLLGTPQQEDLVRILTIPAQRSGYEFEDAELVNTMVKAVAQQPGALALLSFTARKLWDLRDRHLKRLTQKAYQAIGGVGGALAHHAEATLSQMQPGEQLLVREVFRHLVTAEGTRAVLTRKEMREVLGGGPSAEAVLEQLINARLLVASEGTAGEDRVEVIHEALLTSWPRLVKWQREDSESARMRDSLRAGARQWSERGRVKGLLWRGEALIEYRLWRSRYPGSLTETEEAFAAASLRDEKRGRLIRRGLLAATIVGLVAGMVVVLRANRRAEANAKVAAANAQVALERLIHSHEEAGRQLLLEGKAQEAIAYLSKAYSEGDEGHVLQYLLGKAMRLLEGPQVTLTGHTGRLFSAKFSPDGSQVVTASADGTARIWDSRTGQLQITLTHGDFVRTARFSPDGRKVLTGSRDGTAKIWDAITGKMLVSLVHRPEVWDAEFNRSGTLVVTAGEDHHAQLWDAATGNNVASLAGHKATVHQAFFSPEGERLVTLSRDETAKLWAVRGPRLIATLQHHNEPRAGQFSSDGQRLVTAEREDTRIWNATTGQLLSTMVVDSYLVWSAVFAPDGHRLATGGEDKVAKIWELPSGKLLHRLEGHSGTITSLQFSPDGRKLVSASFDATTRLWDVQTGNLLAPLFSHADSVGRAEFSTLGDRMIAAGWDYTATIWDAARTSSAKQFIGHTGETIGVRFSSQGKRLVTVSYDKTIKLWDVERGALLSNIPLGDMTPSFLAVSPDGDRAIVGDEPEKGTANVWQLSTGKVLLKLSGHHYPIQSADFSPDGRRIATADQAMVLIHDAFATRPALAIPCPTGHPRVTFSPDGSRVAATRLNNAVVWDSSTGALRLTLSGHSLNVNHVEFSMDGRYLVSASSDQSVRLWDAVTGSLIRIFEAEREQFYLAHINGDSTLIVGIPSGGASGKVYVWDVTTGKVIDRIAGRANEAAFSPVDSLLVVAPSFGPARSWQLGLNTKPSSEITSWVSCHVPFHLEHEQLIRSKPDLGACSR